MLTRSRSAALAVAVLTLIRCHDEEPPPLAQQPAGAGQPSPQFVTATFPEIYQLFLKRSLPGKVKSDLWVRNYQARWVRWTGQLAAFSTTGVKMRQIQPTLTFDISIIINQPQRSQLKKLLKVGKFYTYIARLDKYDDLFRTLYLDQGAILNPNQEGVDGQLDPLPPPLHPVPPAPAPNGQAGASAVPQPQPQREATSHAEPRQ